MRRSLFDIRIIILLNIRGRYYPMYIDTSYVTLESDLLAGRAVPRNYVTRCKLYIWKQVQTYIGTIKTEDKSRHRDWMSKIFLYVTMSRFNV